MLYLMVLLYHKSLHERSAVWRNVPILEKLGVEQFNHMIGKGFRKGGILMKQQLFPSLS